jgi:tRNA(Arg) A34 adenosine deaminase TadA
MVNYYDKLPEYVSDLHSKMEIAIELSRINIRENSGGPFGAAIFELQSNRLIAIGTNLVVASNASILHAEIVAMTLAQQRVKSYNLNKSEGQAYELVTSTEPCAMCFGAIHWSGIRQLVCGARDEDARSIGFDEGPKIRNWRQKLEKQGIVVIQDVCRQQAARVLKKYREDQGIIYNA